jgi:hypothetical protein
MEAGAASARGIGGTEARECAGNQNCCEKGLHVSSILLDRTAVPDHDSSRVIRQRRTICDVTHRCASLATAT